MSGYFITSTDTNVGKTTAALCLMRHFKSLGKNVGCMKPVSAGCQKTPEGLRNNDAEQLIREASIELPYRLVNPFAYEPPIAPHIGAQLSGERIELNTINEYYHEIASKVDLVIVEGAGGWLVPVNDQQTMANVASALNIPVILVVGLRLGCLNHALLTVSSILQHNIPFAGWIANHLNEKMQSQDENLITLERMVPAPRLGNIAYNSNHILRKLEIVDSSFG